MKRRVRLVVLGLIVVVSLLFAYRVRTVFIPFALALFISFLASPLVRIVEERDVPRSSAIILAYAIFAVVTVFVIYFIVPRLATEVEQVLEALPEKTGELQDMARSAERLLDSTRFPSTLQELYAIAVARGRQFLARFAERIIELALAGVSRILYLILAPVLAFYMLRDSEAIRDRIMQMVPRKHRGRLFAISQEIAQALAGFIRGQLIVSAFVGSLISVGLLILKIRFAFLIGLVAGVFNIIPYFGPFIGAAPAVLLALLDSPWKALWVLLLFFAVNQVEGAILAPHVVGESVGLHPLIVIFALLAGGELLGIVGLLVAIPVAATIKVVGQHTIPLLFRGGE